MTPRTKICTGVGISCLAVTVLVYLLLVPFGFAFFGPSLAALVLSELMLFGGLVFAFGVKRRLDSILMAAGGATLACACSAALFVLGLLFVPAQWSMLGAFLSIGMAILLVYGVGLAVLFLAGKSAWVRENCELRAIRVGLVRADMLTEAAERCTDMALRDRVLKLSDDVRYDGGGGGGSAESAMDEDVKALRVALEAGDAATAEKLTDRLFQLERRRKEEMTLTRRGGM